MGLADGTAWEKEHGSPEREQSSTITTVKTFGNLTPGQRKLILSSLRHSYNAVEAKIQEGKYYPIEAGSHNAEALDTLMHTRAAYAELLSYLTPKE